MKKYDAEDISSALTDCGIIQTDVVMMHSSPITLGIFKGKQTSAEMVEALLRPLEEKGTLVAPAFNFDFCKGKPFNRQKSPSKNMGVLSEVIRRFPGAERSRHPMQSVSAIGEFSKDICERDTPSAYSIGGSFDRLLELDAKMLLFGVRFNAASFFHYAEEKLQVPYRYFKTFAGEYVDEDISEQREYKMYVRDLDLNPQLDLHSLEAAMESEGKLRKSKLGMGEIIVFYFKDFYETACEMLEKDLLFFLSNKQDVMDKLSNRNKL